MATTVDVSRLDAFVPRRFNDTLLLEDGMQFDSILFHDKANAWVVTRNLELIRVKL